MVLCARLFDRFVHRSHQNSITDVVRAVVIAVTDVEPLRCSSGSAICSEVLWVSS